MAENILHFGGARYRLNGTGSLYSRFIGLDDVASNQMQIITMAASPGREQLRLGNFTNQRARLELKTININETMKINRIVVFIRPIFFDYPSS